MAGRPKKPLGQKLIEGTFRPDRDGAPDALVRAEGEPVPPDDLAGEARQQWDLIVPGLVRSKVAAACDGPALALMCWWLAQLKATQRDIDNARDMSDDSEASAARLKRLPQLMVMAGIASDKFNAIAARFGLTPSDRAKLRVEPASGPAAMAVPPRKR